MRPLARKIFGDQRGQSLVIVAFSMMGFVGLASISVETAHVYYAYRLLVSSTQAAALAGAQAMPDTTTASANVTAYSSQAGQKNATSILTNAVATPTYLCLSTVTNTLKTPCETSTGGSGGSNAIKVTQTADAPSWIAGLFGFGNFHLSYTATAAMRGGPASTWNIAIVLDATKSMSDPDSGTQCSRTQESCALKGVQALLSDLYPCALGQTCSASDTYVDDIALYVFPPVLASTAPLDYCSGGSGTPTHEYYEVPTLPSTWTYQIIGFSNDYRTSDSSTGLNVGSNIVKATGYSGSHCSGIVAEGGAGTYYAQAIYQAQSDLISEQTANPGSRNAMIILSDGNATATVSYSGSGSNQKISSSSDLQPSSTNSLNGITGNNPTSYTYPSAVGECGQAVVAANDAATAGTVVYSIGYGSPTSGCTSDASHSASLSNNGASWGPGDSPCQAIGAMASASINFFSDDGDGCTATATANKSITSLTSIFHQITASLSSPRLIPNGTT